MAAQLATVRGKHHTPCIHKPVDEEDHGLRAGYHKAPPRSTHKTGRGTLQERGVLSCAHFMQILQLDTDKSQCPEIYIHILTWLSSNPSIHGFNRLSSLDSTQPRTGQMRVLREPQAACRYPMKELHSMSNQLATPLRRRILATGLALAAFALAGCSGEQKGTQPATTATNQKLVIKVGHAATESTPATKGWSSSTACWAKRRAPHQPGDLLNSQLGSERELIEAVQLGSVGTTFVSSAPLGGFKKEFFALDLPFVFKDRPTV